MEIGGYLYNQRETALEFKRKENCGKRRNENWEQLLSYYTDLGSILFYL